MVSSCSVNKSVWSGVISRWLFLPYVTFEGEVKPWNTQPQITKWSTKVSHTQNIAVIAFCFVSIMYKTCMSFSQPSHVQYLWNQHGIGAMSFLQNRLCGRVPFQSDNAAKLEELILQGELKFMELEWINTSQGGQWTYRTHTHTCTCTHTYASYKACVPIYANGFDRSCRFLQKLWLQSSWTLLTMPALFSDQQHKTW